MAHQYSKRAAIGIGLLLPCIVSVPTFAQGLEEVVVTATRREERLQDIPIAVSVVSGQTVAEGGFADMQDVSAFTPNLSVQDGFQGQTLLVRGIGTDTRNEAFEQAVAQFSDGVYYGRDNMALNGLFDLERVEVVRGPQPVFAGQSATAGAINIISRKPGDELDGNISVEYGDDEEMSVQAAVGGPITDTFKVRVAARYYDLPDAGYEQLVTGVEIGAQEQKAARLTAVWEPTDTFDLTFKYEFQDVYQNGTPAEYGRCDTDIATSTGGPLTPVAPIGNPPRTTLPSMCMLESLMGFADLTRYNREAHSGGTIDIYDAIARLNSTYGLNYITPIARGLNNVREYRHGEDRNMTADIFAGSWNWQLGSVTLSGITGYVSSDKEDWLDPDESAFALFTDQRGEEFEQISQEIRLTSAKDQFVAWMVGAYWQTHDADLFINVHYPFVAGPPIPGVVAISPGGALNEESDWTSLFFTTTWNFTDNFRLNIGARYQDVSKDGTYEIYQANLAAGATAYGPRVRTAAPALNATVESDDVLPEVGVQWNPTQDMMVYAKYAEAFKAGGFVMNPPLGGVAPSPFTFLPEEANGYEIGFKGTLFDGNLQLNIAYFDTEFENLQVNSFNGTTARFEVRNAAASETKGFEIDGRFAAGQYFTMGFSAGTNDAKYTSFPNGQCGAIQARDWTASGRTGSCVVDISGRSLGVPEWQVSISPEVVLPLGQFTGKAGLNGTWIDGTENPANPGDTLARIPQRYRFDLRLALAPERGNWEVALYARDLTDEAAHVGGLQSGFFNGTNGRTNSDIHLYGVGGKRFERGRRVGIQASYFLGK